VKAPTKYETVINLKNAKVLGLDVPPAVLVRADEAIDSGPICAPAHDGFWHIATFRCDAELGRYRGIADIRVKPHQSSSICDGVDAPSTASMCQSGGVEPLKGGVRVRG
jgi:hypothetical protein